MLVLLLGLALATETPTPAQPDATPSVTATPAEPAQDRKFLSAAVDAGRSEVEVETPAVEKREEEMRERQVMQIADEVKESLHGKSDATSGSSEKKEEVMKHENLATAEAPEASRAESSEAKREVTQIAAEVQEALGHEEAAKQSSEEAAKKGSEEEAAKKSEEEAAKKSEEKTAELVEEPKVAENAPTKVLQAELTETALVATRANSTMHFATLLACLVSIALIGHLRRRRTDAQVNQPPLLG
jgi:hypothetical protein